MKLKFSVIFERRSYIHGYHQSCYYGNITPCETTVTDNRFQKIVSDIDSIGSLCQNYTNRVPEKDCAHIEVFQNNYKQRPLQQAITMKSGYFNEVSGFFCVIPFGDITSV